MHNHLNELLNNNLVPEDVQREDEHGLRTAYQHANCADQWDLINEEVKSAAHLVQDPGEEDHAEDCIGQDEDYLAHGKQFWIRFMLQLIVDNQEDRWDLRIKAKAAEAGVTVTCNQGREEANYGRVMVPESLLYQSVLLILNAKEHSNDVVT